MLNFIYSNLSVFIAELYCLAIELPFHSNPHIKLTTTPCIMNSPPQKYFVTNTKNLTVPPPAFDAQHLRVEAGGRILSFLNKSGHVLQEQIMHVLLIHISELDAGTLRSLEVGR